MENGQIKRGSFGLCLLGALAGTASAGGGFIFNNARTITVNSIPNGNARFADLNGDGTLDFVMGYGGNQNSFRIAMGMGDGTAGDVTTFTITAGEGATIQDVIPYDIDGDGDIDLVALARVLKFGEFNTFQVARLQAYENDGTGSFTALGTLTTTLTQSDFFDLPNLARLGDFDGDGARDDIAIAHNESPRLRTYTWSGGWSEILVPSLLSDGIRDFVVLDFDADGLDDLEVAYRGSDLVSVRRNTGGFTEVRTLSTSSAPYFVEAGDFDGDMMPDLLVFVGSEVTMFPNGGDDFAGSGSSTGLGSPGTPSASDLDRIAVGDINDDGFDDFVFERKNANSNKDVFINTTDGTFTFTQSPTMTGRALSLVDLNSDGLLDLVGTSNTESPRVLLNELGGNSCPADLSGDGDLNFLDVSLLLSEMVDYNEDMSFNFLDVSMFLVAFAAGCP